MQAQAGGCLPAVVLKSRLINSQTNQPTNQLTNSHVQLALLAAPVVGVVHPLVHRTQAGLFTVALPPTEYLPTSQRLHPHTPANFESP